jgi:hypothetical protein
MFLYSTLDFSIIIYEQVYVMNMAFKFDLWNTSRLSVYDYQLVHIIIYKL